MNPLSEFLSDTIGIEPWVASLIAIVAITFIVSQIAHFLLRQMNRATDKTPTVWDGAIVEAATPPLRVALWVIGLGFMARVLQGQTQAAFVDQALAARDLAIIVCAAWFVLRVIGKVGSHVLEDKRARDEEVDATTIDALGKLARLLTVVVAILVAAQTLGFEITGLLALGGVGGLAVGLAAKDLLANFFGGLTIYMDRPFSVGDWVRSPDKQIEGTVEYISWRHTRIRAFNKNPLHVPNAIFTNIVVENPSRMSHRRFRETIGVRYDDMACVAAVASDIRTMLKSHDEVDQDETIIVNVTSFGASSVDLLVQALSRTTGGPAFAEIKQDILLKIAGIVEGHGADFAFPTQTLHIASGGMVPDHNDENSSDAASNKPSDSVANVGGPRTDR